MINEILAKNLECIKKYNENIVKKIEKIANLTLPIELCKTKKDEYNILIDGVYVHSQDGAEDEAKKIFNSLAHNNTNSIHVTFGLGLGYLFQELCDNAQGYVILYEENIEILRAVLEVVDFSNVLLKQNIKIATDLNELKNCYYSFFTPQSKISVTFLDFYKKYFLSDLNKVIKELELAQGIAQGSYDFKTAHSKCIATNFINRFDEKIKLPCITTLKDKFANMPAIIVAAGSSLYDNLELIKQYQNKAIIFCVGTAYKALIANGINPDFVSVIETNNVANQVDGTNTQDVNLITDTTAHPAILDYKYKNVFVYPSRENTINLWYSDLMHIYNGQYETKGTVAYNALCSAYQCGCNPIILIGQDLAYVNDCCYAKTSPYASLKCRYNDDLQKWEVYSDNFEEMVNTMLMNTGLTKEQAEGNIQYRLRTMSERVVDTKDKHGKNVRTDISFILFAKYLSDFAEKYKDNRIFINSTPDGLKIDNFIEMDFKEALEKYTAQDIQIDSIIEDAKKSYKTDYDYIIKKLADEISILENNFKSVDKIKDYLNDLKIQLKNTKKPLKETKMAMRKALDTFADITTQMPSILLNNLIYKEQEELNQFLKNNTQDFTLESIMHLCQLLNNYFECVQNDGTVIFNILKEMKEKINESTYTTC